MPQATFDLVLSREKVLLFYKAKKNRIQVTARDGRTINLPWELLRPHIQPRASTEPSPSFSTTGANANGWCRD